MLTQQHDANSESRGPTTTIGHRFADVNLNLTSRTYISSTLHQYPSEHLIHLTCSHRGTLVFYRSIDATTRRHILAHKISKSEGQAADSNIIITERHLRLKHRNHIHAQITDSCKDSPFQTDGYIRHNIATHEPGLPVVPTYFENRHTAR